MRGVAGEIAKVPGGDAAERCFGRTARSAVRSLAVSVVRPVPVLVVVVLTAISTPHGEGSSSGEGLSQLTSSASRVPPFFIQWWWL